MGLVSAWPHCAAHYLQEGEEARLYHEVSLVAAAYRAFLSTLTCAFSHGEGREMNPFTILLLGVVSGLAGLTCIQGCISSSQTLGLQAGSLCRQAERKPCALPERPAENVLMSPLRMACM